MTASATYQPPLSIIYPVLRDLHPVTFIEVAYFGTGGLNTSVKLVLDPVAQVVGPRVFTFSTAIIHRVPEHVQLLFAPCNIGTQRVLSLKHQMIFTSWVHRLCNIFSIMPAGTCAPTRF